MNIILVSLLIFLVILIVSILAILIVKFEKENKQKTITTIFDILYSKNFEPLEVCYVNRKLSFAINKNYSKLAVIENFNPNNPDFYNYFEILTSSIETIEKNVAIKIHYLKSGQAYNYLIYPASNYVLDFFHRVFKNACLRKVQIKYPNIQFNLFATSDWEVSYVWAFCKKNSKFVYFKTGKTPSIKDITLKREHFTIDTKYKYFEAPIFGINQQLFSYEKEFLFELYGLLKEDIEEKYSPIAQNEIYFDNYSNILYLSNGITSLQSIILPEIEEIYYRDNRVSFEVLNSQKVINFMASPSFIVKLEDFIIDNNLRKIALGFNQKTDRIINATLYTKFIVDYTRDRLIYCANMNKLAGFNYMIISFGDLYDAQVKKSGLNNFVRIFTKYNKIIDVTCDKREIAQYIQAQIKGLLN